MALAQRLAFGLLVLMVIIFLTHFGLEMARGIAFQPALTSGADKTIQYLGDLAHGELGLTTAGSINLRSVPVAEVVPERAARSLGLLTVSLLLAAVLGISLGVWAGVRRKSRWPVFTLLASIIGISVPSFFAALLLQMAVIRLTRTTGTTILPVGGFGWDKHLILPALVLAARPLAQIARVTYVTLSETLDRDYVRTAYSKGLTDNMVMAHHVLRNVAVPVLTTVGLSLRFSLSSLPVVEFFFGWPGLGFTLLKSISMQDDNLTVALVLILGAFFILVNVLLDLSYRVIDPRLREQVDQVERLDRVNLWEWFTARWWGLKRFLNDNMLVRRIRKEGAAEPDPFLELLSSLEDNGEEEYTDGRPGELRAWVKGTLGNFPFVVGGLLVAGLVVVLLFGVQLSPHSPYTTRGLEIINGEFSVPPFEPGADYPWGTDVLGRDIMSLILSGAQQTLILAGLVVLARLVVGFLLGALAGWFSGSWIDRLVVSLTEILNAFPTLLLAMILILGLGIRNGFPPFVIALCFLGWGEIMQFVRGQVMSLKPSMFVESAVAVGQRSSRIIFKHILPNLIPGLISLTSLEMGAVLMLLGELGFIGIFIGGGAFAELDVASAPYHYSDVPEWGALLSNVRAYARSYPWTALYPALAFFLAISGFNLFGEGIRRMIETVGVSISRVFNRYAMGLTVVAVVGFIGIRGATGSMAVYERQTVGFRGDKAMQDLLVLSDPALEGRALGTPGMDIAADYIAEKFKALGVQPAGEKLTYFQTRYRDYELLTDVPTLSVDDGGPPAVYRQDFAEYPNDQANMGEAYSKVTLVALGDLSLTGNWFTSYRALQGMELGDEIIMVLSDRDAALLGRLPRGGMLVVADDPSDLARQETLSPRPPRYTMSNIGREIAGVAPTMYISQATADRILAGGGRTVHELRTAADELGQDEVLQIPLDTTVHMTVKGQIQQRFPVRHVIGNITGLSDSRFGGLNNQMIVVMAQYDSPPPSPTGAFYPGANDNASGVAVMLEAIRNMKESGYQPYRTILFVAYSGEGFEGGEYASREVSKFLQAKSGFSNAFDVVAVVELRGLGAGEGDRVEIQAGGSLRLANLFSEAADRMKVPARRGGEQMDISIVFEERSLQEGGQEAPHVGLTWDGWEATSHVAADSPRIVSQDKLEEAGRTLSMALMVLGREESY
jgi:ABC-type dipeptide/oligopeptide/nickel transport system permease component